MRKFAAVTVILGALRLSNGQPCPPGTYRDHVTGRCDHCSDICQFKEITGTVHECLAQCPDYDQRTSTDVSPALTTTHGIPSCDDGLVYIDSLSRCDTCHSLCLSQTDGTKTQECRTYCPAEYTGTKQTTLNKEQVVTTSVIALCVTVIIVAAVGLLTLYRRKRTRPRDPRPQEAPVPPLVHPHPTVSYVPVSIHVQCEDSNAEERYPTEEEEKFPRAFPDLPSTARPVNGVNGTRGGHQPL